jgi:cardiolipin synthase
VRFRTGFALLAILGGCAAEPLLRFGPGIETPDDQTLQLGLQDALTESKPTRGNRVVLLRDGVRTLPAMFAAMAAARDHINLEYFTFDNIAANPSPASGAANGVANGVANGAASAGARTLADLLLDRLAHGVQVDIIYDAFGSQDTDAAFIDRLRKSGAHVLAFNPGLVTKAGTLINPNDRDHRKILVVDGRAAFIGGVNLDRHPEPDGDSNVSVWRDVDARIDGPAVADLQRLFLDTWRKQSSESLPPRDWFPPVGPSGREVIRIIGSAPGEDRPLYYVSVMTAIHASRHSISVSTGYFVPTHQEREELAQAARRGVQQ